MIVICYSPVVKSALSAALKVFGVYVVVLAPEAFSTGASCCDTVIAETMRLVCTRGQQVLVLGAPNDLPERKLQCKKFRNSVIFAYYAGVLGRILKEFSTPWLFPGDCDRSCTVFPSPGFSTGNLVAGRLISKICHDLIKFELPTFGARSIFNIREEINELENSFIPPHRGEASIIREFVASLRDIENIALNNPADLKNAIANIAKRLSRQGFPYFAGEFEDG